MSIIHRLSTTVLRHGLRSSGSRASFSAASTLKPRLTIASRTTSGQVIQQVRHYSTGVAPNSNDNINSINTISSDDIPLSQKLETLQKDGCSQESLVEFLQACQQKRDFATAQQALQLARDAKIPITTDIYANVILAGSYELRFSELRELYGEPLQQSFGEAPEVVEHSAHYESIKTLLSAMRSVGLELPMWFYETMVGRMYGAGQAGIIVNFIVSLEKRGITPSIQIYNKALHLLPRKNLIDRAEALFNKLIMRDIANYQTYTTWLAALITLERYTEAEQLFRTLNKKFTPDVIAYNILINGRLRADNFTSALDLFDKMRSGQIPGATPDSYTLSTFLDHMLATGNIQYCQRIFPFLSEYGFPSSSQNYALLLRFFARYDDSQFGPLLKSLMLPVKKDFRDILFYNSLLRILTDGQVLAEVKREIGTVLSEGLTSTPSSTASSSTLQEVVATAPPATKAIVNRMEHEGVKPDEFSLEYIMRQVVNRNDKEGVERVYAFAQTLKGVTSYALRNLRLASLLQQRNLAEAEKMLQDMRTTRVPIYPKNLTLCRELHVRLPEGILAPGGRRITSQNNNGTEEFVTI